MILYMGLPITTTISGQWLINSLIFHEDIKCITTNEHADDFYVGAD